MSIKAFHIFFVTLSTLFSLGLGGWAVREYRLDGAISNLILSGTAFLFGAVLAGYGGWFVRKVRGL